MTTDTPQGILKLFRATAAPYDDEQAIAFRKMPIADQCELIFRMGLYTNAILRQLQGKVENRTIDPEPMPEIPKEN